MHLGKKNMMATIGMAAGILIIAGSAIGGIALAADRDREPAPDPAGSTAPLGNESDLTPTATPDDDDSPADADDDADDADGADDDGDDSGAASQPAGSARPDPSATPTCTTDDDPAHDDHPTDDCDRDHG